MSKRIIGFTVGVFVACLFLTSAALATQLLTKDAALEKVFGKGTQVTTENIQLSDAQIAKAKERLGGSLVYAQRGAKSSSVEASSSVDFYFAMKDGKKAEVAIIDSEPGKWGAVEFIIALDLQGTVKQVEVLSLQEKRGQPISRHSFMSQYEGKTSKSPLEVNKDITGVSGATISSRCATFAVKKAIILYETVYLNK